MPKFIGYTTYDNEDAFAHAEGVCADDTLHPDGTQAPFVVFITSMQEYLPIEFPTKEEADRMARILCELKGT